MSKTVSSVTCILLTACYTAKEEDQALIITVKFMVDFVTYFSSETVKCISNLYVLTNLNNLPFPQPPQPTSILS